MKKLKGAYLDDDSLMLEIIRDTGRSSSLLEITETFSCPKTFLKELPRLDCDVCLIDIVMPDLDGITVSKRINGLPFIYVTAAKEVLGEALGRNPIDILTKPVTLDRYNQAAEKVLHYYEYNTRQKKHEIFHISGTRMKVNILLDDIMVVLTDKAECRNKELIMRNGRTYKVTGHSLEDLLKIAPKLVRINIGELVSTDAIEDFSSDTINLKDIIINGKKRTLSVNRSFKRSFIDTIVCK
jgi:two-component SAPR family response regulator